MRLWIVALVPVLLCALPGCGSPKPAPAAAGPTSTPPDSDGDGVPDSRDQCPMQPEDYDGHLDGDGCPDYDTDSHEIILDVDDKCPLFLECEEGFEDFDGCPDAILRIDFARDSVLLDARADDLLAEIAAELIARKRVLALRLDRTFAAGESQNLAGIRAGIVRDRLMHHGVAGSMLTMRSHSQPAAAPGHVAPAILKCR